MERKSKNSKIESRYWKEFNEKRALKFLSFIKEIMGNYVGYGEVRNPMLKVSYLLEHLNSPALINTISFYMDYVEDSMIDEKGFVLELLQILCKYPYGVYTEHLLESYNGLSIIESARAIQSGFEIKTRSGTIKVYRALEKLRWKREYIKAYQKITQTDVELRMALLNTKFPEDMIVSCFMPRMFGGVSYEYYIKLLKEKGFLDLRHGCFYPEELFESYFEPKILSKRKGKNLKTDIPPLFVKK